MTLNNVLNYFEQPKSGSQDNTFVCNGTVVSTKVEQVYYGNITIAESNAGKVLVPGIEGKTIIVTGFDARVYGNYASLTSWDVKSDDDIVSFTFSQPALTNNAVLDTKTANVAFGAVFLSPLAVGKGLKVVNGGAAATGGTSIALAIRYIVI